MKLVNRSGKAYRTAKLEHHIIEESASYKYDDEGNIEINPETGEAEINTEKTIITIFTRFKYNMVDQASLDKNQYISNIWNQDCTFTIKTFDDLNISTTDRVIINDKAYSITNIYKDFDDSTASMFNNGGYYVTYIGLKGAVSL